MFPGGDANLGRFVYPCSQFTEKVDRSEFVGAVSVLLWRLVQLSAHLGGFGAL